MNIKPLLDFIGQLEAHGNYNAIYGRAGSPEDLSQYTLNQLRVKMVRQGKLTGSSATGRYQFITKTLDGLRERLGLDGSERFTPALQDDLAEALLEGRGLHRWAAGRMSDAQFMDSLSREWASLPYRTGRSFYDGDGMNHSLTTREKFAAVLQQVKRGAA